MDGIAPRRHSGLVHPRTVACRAVSITLYFLLLDSTVTNKIVEPPVFHTQLAVKRDLDFANAFLTTRKEDVSTAALASRSSPAIVNNKQANSWLSADRSLRNLIITKPSNSAELLVASLLQKYKNSILHNKQVVNDSATRQFCRPTSTTNRPILFVPSWQDIPS